MMNDGFVRIAAVSPSIKVADPAHNGKVSFEDIRKAVEDGAKVIVLPECTMTSYISNDFLYQDTLLQAAEDELAKLVARTASFDVVFIIGIPLRINCTLYNSAAVCHKGRILGIVPKTHIPTYGVDFEGRWFEPGPAEISMVNIAGQTDVPFGSHQVFRDSLMPELCIGVEICEDIWSPNPPSIHLALAGATVLCNCSASNASIEKAPYRRGLISGQSARLLGSYVYCSSGNGDSTEDVTVGGHDLITENGNILAEAKPFGSGYVIADVDVESLSCARRGMSSFVVAGSPELAGYRENMFEMNVLEQPLLRKVDARPFVPSEQEACERCEIVTNIQAHGLAAKMRHADAKKAIARLSDDPNGLLAILLCARAFDIMGLPHENILIAHGKDADIQEDLVYKLAVTLGCTVDELYDDGLPAVREYAKKKHAIIVGAYDMTELALGAVPGDDLNLDYAVNSTIGRTLTPLLVRYLAHKAANHDVGAFADAMNTLPEMLSVKGEGDVGPVVVMDFYLSCLLDSKDTPAKTLRLAKSAFAGTYEPEQLLGWLKVFYKRFFGTQYERRNLPDGPEVGGVNISPRGGFMMPARNAGILWLQQVEELEV